MWLAESLSGLGIVYKPRTGSLTPAATVTRLSHWPRQSSRPPRLANLFHNFAGLDHAQHRFVEGEPHARRSLSLRMLGEGPAPTAAAGDLAVRGALLLGQDRNAEAERALQERNLT
jgi:hypothetical protein